MIEFVYVVSTVVVIAAAIIASTHRELARDCVRSTLLAGVAVFGLIGLDRPAPGWMVGFMAFLAAACLWVGARWARARRKYAAIRAAERALRQRV